MIHSFVIIRYFFCRPILPLNKKGYSLQNVLDNLGKPRLIP